MSSLLAPKYQNEDAAREHLEATRWPDGPICPHCGIIGEAFKLAGKTTRKGLWKCSACREPFTVTIGTIFEDSKIPLHKWLLAIHLMCSSKKGISAHQLMRNLGLGSYRTAWFMAHRVRWALGEEPVKSKLAGIVEADETYVGGKEKGIRGAPRPTSKKTPVVSLMERGGDVRSFPVERITLKNIGPILKEHIEADANLMTDESAIYYQMKPEFAAHDTVNHSKDEYARRENGKLITTNTVEGYFSLVKRAHYGVFHHWDRKYMSQYLREFDYRYNVRKMDDGERFTLALKKTGGKRLMLKDPKSK